MALVGGVGLLRYDLAASTSYRRVPVVSVQQVPGQDMAERAVTVDLGERRRLLRTADWLIQTSPGQPVCVAERTLLLRRFIRVSLVLPGHCGPFLPAPQEVKLSSFP